MAVAEHVDITDRRRTEHLLSSGWFEAVPAILLMLLAVFFNRLAEQPVPALALDAATCVAAALASRFPRTAGLVLAGCLALYLAVPVEWATLGEYAPLIPILGTGMRELGRIRAAMTIGYGLLLVLIAARNAPTSAGAIMGVVAWLILLAMAWIVGNVFVAVARSHERRRRAESVLARQRLARDLHDTVARSLAVVSMLGEQLQEQTTVDAEKLDALIDAARSSHSQLRLVMGLLRDPVDLGTSGSTGSSSLAEALRVARSVLHQHGFPATFSIEGDLNLLTTHQSDIAAAVAGEAFANLVKHGDPARPTAVVVSIGPEHADLMVLNHVRSAANGARTDETFGLWGMRERLAEVGGTMTARQIGAQWQVHVQLPVATAGTPARSA